MFEKSPVHSFCFLIRKDFCGIISFLILCKYKWIIFPRFQRLSNSGPFRCFIFLNKSISYFFFIKLTSWNIRHFYRFYLFFKNLVYIVIVVLIRAISRRLKLNIEIWKSKKNLSVLIISGLMFLFILSIDFLTREILFDCNSNNRDKRDENLVKKNRADCLNIEEKIKIK